MVEKGEVKAEVPNVGWMADLTDEQYERVKKRYAEFARFSFRLLFKELMKMQVIVEDSELQNAFTLEIMRELADDKTLPASFRKRLQDEIKAEEAKTRQASVLTGRGGVATRQHARTGGH